MERRRWFRKGNGVQEADISLKSADQAVQEHNDFKTRIMTSFNKRRIECYDDRKGLLVQICSVLDSEELRDQARIAIGEADGALDQVTEKRQHGYGRFGHGVQEFALSFAGFVRVYGSFVDVIRQAGGVYAEVAYGTLSIFLMVAINKSENDSKFSGTLKELQNSFPRVNLAEEIYPEVNVKAKASEVYRQVIVFAQKATEYFLASSSVRMLKGIVRPAQLAVDKAIEELHRCLAEVNAEIGILLHKSVRSISSQNEILMAEARNLREEVAGLRAQMTSMNEDSARKQSAKDVENLASCRRMLGEVSENNRDPGFCAKTLEGAFPEAMRAFHVYAGWSENYIQMTFELLESDAAYQSWKNSSTASLLAFAGSTSDEGRASESLSLSWLSPAALHAFNKFSSEGKKVAFHSCHPELRVEPSSSRLVISSLLYQIFGWKPQMLRHRAGDFESDMKSDAWNFKPTKENAWNSREGLQALEHQLDLLRQVLDLFATDNEQIVVILDRPDLCHGKKYRFLKVLQKLITRCQVNLKVLVIMDRIWDDYERSECRELLHAGTPDHAFGNVDWDQLRTSY